MTEFTSRYAELTFYVGDVAKRFSGGRYVTEDTAEIAELSKLTDVERIDTPEEAAKPRKTGANTSDK
jgi:hypothetical protein